MSTDTLSLKVYTADELKKRNGIESHEIWIAYKGLIYDVSDSPLFAGGKHYRHNSGCDLTDQMALAPHLDDVMNKFRIVGKISDESH